MTLRHVGLEKYRSYLPTAFDESLTLLQKMNKLIAFLNHVVDTYNSLDENVTSRVEEVESLIVSLQVEMAEFKDDILSGYLPENIEIILDAWFLNGKLADIINNQVFDMKLDKTIFEQFELSTNQQFAETHKLITTITPEHFGAIGDGVTDDTQAFQQAIAYMKDIVSKGKQTFYTNLIFKLDLKPTTYFVKGHHVIDLRNLAHACDFIIQGNGATLVWEVEHDTDNLVNIATNVEAIKVYDTKFYTCKDISKSFNSGGDIFKFTGSAINTKNVFDGCSFSLAYGSNTTVNGRIGVRIRRVFSNIAPIMNDQSLVKNCHFRYFVSAYHSTNQEAVNWNFENCGFFGGGGNETQTIYFDFTRMGDNFNVTRCSFSLSADSDKNKSDILLKTRSPIGSNGLLTQSTFFNFNFL